MGLHEMQIQATRLHTGVGRSDTTSTNLALQKTEAIEFVHSSNTRAIVLPNGVLSAEMGAHKVIFSTLKNIGLNFATLQSELLHMLQAGVIVKLRAREQHALSVISEQKVNNE